MGKKRISLTAGAAEPAELGQAAAAIRIRSGAVITSHVQPDGDSVGSSIALALGLKALGKRVRVLLPDPCPEKYRFLDPGGLLEHRQASPEDLGRWDLGILLDASEPSRIGALEKPFFQAPFPRLCLDHHRASRDPGYLFHIVDPAVPATGCLVLRLLDHLLVPVTGEMASALFVALATDTGWFRFANTSSGVLRDAARLVQAGADPERLYRMVFEQFRPARMRLLGKVIEVMREELGGALVWSWLDQRLIEESGVPRQEFEGLIDPLRTIRGVQVAALAIETEPGVWKVSLRSTEGIDVQKVAARLGGGGHARAAGCTLAGSREAAESLLKEEVDSLLKSSRA